MNIYIYICIYIYVYIYMCIYIYKYDIHMYIYTHRDPFSLGPQRPNRRGHSSYPDFRGRADAGKSAGPYS